LNSSQAEEDAGVGFDEVAEEAEGQVSDHEEFEGVAGEENCPWSLVVSRWRRLCFSQKKRGVRALLKNTGRTP
jgi:hypothetical protein